MSVPDDYRPSASTEVLRLRARLLSQVRQFFQNRDFLEVETPILSIDVVVDRHLDPFFTSTSQSVSEICPDQQLWLQTSPEFHMKRLVASGSGPIFQIARVFRQGEQGPRHNPEFSLVEWYAPHSDYQAGMQLLAELCDELLRRGKATYLSYQRAFEEFAGIDPHRAPTSALKSVAEQRGIVAPASLTLDDRDGWLDLLLVTLVESHLGVDHPTILYDYPASQAALARTRREPDGIQIAERFELYVDSLELANGYHELRDAAELRLRNQRQNELRRKDNKSSLPEQSRLLAAMTVGLPDCVGAALGFDRVVMCAAKAKSISEVLAFPFDRA